MLLTHTVSPRLFSCDVVSKGEREINCRLKNHKMTWRKETTKEFSLVFEAGLLSSKYLVTQQPLGCRNTYLISLPISMKNSLPFCKFPISLRKISAPNPFYLLLSPSHVTAFISITINFLIQTWKILEQGHFQLQSGGRVCIVIIYFNQKKKKNKSNVLSFVKE